MSARMEAVQKRQEAEILELCADAQDKLRDAKTAYDEDPSEENLAAKQKAMEDMHNLRRWLRQHGKPVTPEGSVVVGQAEAMPSGKGDGQALPPARPKGRLRRDA